MDWFKVTLKLQEVLKEGVINRLVELGAQGVSEEGLTSDSITAYFQSGKQNEIRTNLMTYLESLRQLGSQEAREIKVEISAVEDTNWAEEYKKYYFAQPLSKRFFLRPAWDTVTKVPDHQISIVLDPGAAFGTGLHPSTQLALNLLEQSVELHPRTSGIRLLDVGTGTGILAIAAYKLGIRSITAMDNDSDAVEAARENLALNQCPGISLSSQTLDKHVGEFDIILSNIMLSTHQSLFGEYLRLLASGGQLVLSGLLSEQKEEAFKLVQSHGFEVDNVQTQKEWIALLTRRASPSSSSAT